MLQTKKDIDNVVNEFFLEIENVIDSVERALLWENRVKEICSIIHKFIDFIQNVIINQIFKNYSMFAFLG